MGMIKKLTDKFTASLLKCDSEQLCSEIVRQRTDKAIMLAPHCTELNDGKYLPLEDAIITQNLPIVKTLLDVGVSMERQSPYTGMTALDLAISWRFTDGAKELVERGADIEKPCLYGDYSPFQQALMFTVGFENKPFYNEKEPYIFRTLIEPTPDGTQLGFSFEECVAYQEPERKYLEESGLHDLLGAFIKRGVDLNAPDKTFGITPMETVAYGAQGEFFIERTATFLANKGALVTDKVLEIVAERKNLGLDQHFRRLKVEQERDLARKQKLKI